MAVTAAGISAMSVILKEFYEGPIAEQLNSEILLMKRLSKRADIVEGKTIVMPLHIGRNVGVMATSEGGVLPSAGKQQYADMRFPIPLNYGHINMTGPVMAASRSRRGAFASVLEAEIEGLTRDFKNDINRQCWMDGSGRLAGVNNVAGAVMTVQNPLDWNNQGAVLQYLNLGDRISFIDVSAATQNIPNNAAFNYGNITAIDFNAKTITSDVDFSATMSAGDMIVKGATGGVLPTVDNTSARLSTGATANVNKEIMGIAGICSGTNGWSLNIKAAGAYTALPAGKVWANNNNGVTAAVTADLQTVSAATTTQWQANMLFNGGVLRPLTGDLMQRACDLSEQIGQARPTIIMTSYGCRRICINLSTGDRRFSDGNFDAGSTELHFNKIPIIPDKDAIPGAMFFLSEPDLMFADMSDFHWFDKDGAVLSRAYSSAGALKDEWEAVLALYRELVTRRRNAQTVIGDIRET